MISQYLPSRGKLLFILNNSPPTLVVYLFVRLFEFVLCVSVLVYVYKSKYTCICMYVCLCVLLYEYICGCVYMSVCVSARLCE